MIVELLNAAAIPSKAGRFPDPPKQTYAVYFDHVTADGPDAGPSRIFTHDYEVELYAPTIEDGEKAKARLDPELDARGLHYTTQGWYWLKDAQRYQEIYEFTHIEKT